MMKGTLSIRLQAIRLQALALLAIFALLGQIFPLFAQTGTPNRLRGTITKVDGPLLTLESRDGQTQQVRLADKARIVAVVKAALADVKPGTFVGITSMPSENGGQRAVEVHIFPEAMRGTGEGQRPWDLGADSTMTNGTIDLQVDAVSGQELTVGFKGGSAKIEVPPEAAIVALAPAQPEDLKPGNKLIAFGLKRGDDGILEAAAVSIGRDGLIPPM